MAEPMPSVYGGEFMSLPRRRIPLSNAPLLKQQPSSWRRRWRRLPLALRVIGLGLLLYALSRPMVQQRLPQRTQGIDIMLAIDVSSSMAARDMDLATDFFVEGEAAVGNDPQASRTRLQVAQDAAIGFLNKRTSDRISLIKFARFADLISPRTQHYEALRAQLNTLQCVTADGPEDQTGIGLAIARSAQILQRSLAKSKVLILLTDGEETLATAPNSEEITIADAAGYCQQAGIRIYLISSRPNAKALELPSNIRQFLAQDADNLKQIYSLIDALEKSELEEPRYQWVERFLPFLLAGLLALFVARLLAETKLEATP
ncbi:MAG: VWA domain-containing protein [Planctomycetes bacterium]|nr:VWA domain-containing protein [Planctomycetota bacterium]